MNVRCCCFFVFFLKKKKNNIGIGLALDMLSQVSFIFLLVLIARGWAITHMSLSHKKRLLGILVTFFCLYLIVFVWAMAFADSATTYYEYESWAGILLVVIKRTSE